MKRILVIEDEPEMRRNLLTILKMEKYQPLGAENGKVGLQLARSEKPDLILCDVMMPELDGYGVLRALREDPCNQDHSVHLPDCARAKRSTNVPAWTSERMIISQSRLPKTTSLMHDRPPAPCRTTGPAGV